MNRRYNVFIIACALLISCAGGNKLKHSNYNCTAKVQQAIGKYNEKKYSKTATILEDVKLQCGGNPIMDTALYYLSMSYLRSKKYIEAHSEFERLARDFASSMSAEEAQFRIAQITYLQSNPPDRDQTETKDAIRLLRDFIDAHPDSPWADSADMYLSKANDKLAEKEFRNGLFYDKINEPDAAVVYYKAMIQEYPGSRFADQARLNLAQDLIGLKRYDEAREVLDELDSVSKNQEVLKKSKELRSRLK